MPTPVKSLDNMSKHLTKDDTSNIVGEGELTLDSTGLCYRGSCNGEQVELRQNIMNLPTYGMCTDVSRVYTFIDGEFCEFFPESRSIGKWLHCTEELHRHMGGKWRNFEDYVNRYSESTAESCANV